MIKKICTSVLLLVFIVTLSMQGFAWNRNVFYDESTPSTSQFLVTITRPEGDETTLKRDYVICANTDVDNLVIAIFRYQSQSGTYRPINGTDANSTWEIGKSGIVVKQIELPRIGANQLRVIAYKKSEANYLQLNYNLQVNNYTVTLLDSGMKDAIKNGFFRLSEMFSQLWK